MTSDSMRGSKFFLVFELIIANLVPGIINDPLLSDIFGAAVHQTYVLPTNMPGLQMGVDVEISIRAEYLRDTDLLTKSDPICYTSTKVGFMHQWTRVHQTEMILNDVSPTFMLKPIMSTAGAENTSIKFDFYDKDTSRDDVLGTSTANLGQLIAQGTTSLPMQKSFMGVLKTSVRGKTVITTERLINNSDQVKFNISAHEIAKKDMMSLSDPYIEILKKSPGDNFVLVHRTEHHNNQRSTSWAEFTVPMRQLCNGDFSRPLLFICWDKNFNSKSTLIGQFQTTLQELRFQNRNSFQLLSQNMQFAGTVNVSIQYIGSYSPGMMTGAMPGALPEAMPGAMPGMYASTPYAGAQSYPVGQMGQAPIYGQTANASMMYGQPNASMMYGQPQASMNPQMMTASVPTMQPGVTFAGGNTSTVYPGGYPSTVGAYGTSMPFANPPTTLYGVQPNMSQPSYPTGVMPNMNQPVYPPGTMSPGNQSNYPGNSHYYTRRR